MEIDQILDHVRRLDHVLVLAPAEGSEFPAIAWGDSFFYYAPDGQVPTNRQPYATIVTKDYPEDARSRLDGSDRWRLNIHVGSPLFEQLVGYAPESIPDSVDYSQTDVFLPHPLYGAYGWVCVVNPGAATLERSLEALREAHDADRRRVQRRG